jgi:hypothetical protein
MVMKYKNVTNLTGVDIKAKLYDAVKRGIKVYEEESGRQTRFKEPLIAYANTSEPVFDMFHDNGFCKHPRKVYNAAHAVIVYFLPYTDDIVESNKVGTKPSEQWEQAYHDSTRAIMKIHASLQGELDKFGRLSSLCNTPVDWDYSRCGPEWNFKIVANVAGMGDFGPTGCIITEVGPAGRFGGILTDVNLVPDRNFGFSNTESRGGTPEMFEAFKKYMTDSCYEGDISDELIAACPGKAITKDGINKKACQEYCKTIFEYVPTPDLCGKCYLYNK